MRTVLIISLACLRTFLKIILGPPLKLSYFFSNLLSLCFSYFDGDVKSICDYDTLLGL